MTDLAVQAGTARELTPDEQQARAEACYGIDQRVKAGLRAGRQALWQTAEALYEFDSAAAHTALGYDTLGDWLGDPEIGMTRSTYYRLVKAWRSLVVERQLEATDLVGLDVSKVDVVLPAIEQGKIRQADALEDARSMGWRDLREKYVKPKETPPPPEPDPDPDPVIEPVDPTLAPLGADELDGAEPPPEVDIDAEPAEIDIKKDEPVETEVLDPEPEPRPRADKGPISPAIWDEAMRSWRALYKDLMAAHQSGQEAPRIDATLIGPGLDGLSVLVDQDATVDELLP